eukprot:357715-Chlamydomonas_euryale.AAC.15
MDMAWTTVNNFAGHVPHENANMMQRAGKRPTCIRCSKICQTGTPKHGLVFRECTKSCMHAATE